MQTAAGVMGNSEACRMQTLAIGLFPRLQRFQMGSVVE